MKKIILNVFVFTALIFITSCDSDDDGGDPTTISITGTWQLTSLTTESNIDINNDGTASNDLLVESDCYLDETISFGANGEGTINSNSYLEVTIDLDTDLYSLNCFIEEDFYSMDYTISDNTVTIIDEDMFTVIGIKNGNSLTFTISEGYEIQDEDFNAVVLEDLTFVYTKQ